MILRDKFSVTFFLKIFSHVLLASNDIEQKFLEQIFFYKLSYNPYKTVYN